MPPPSTAISTTSSLTKMPKRSIWPTRPCRWTWAAWARATPWSRSAQAAEARGLTSALISVGGNLRAIGTKPDGSQWAGGVENPWNSSEVYTNGSSTVAAVKMSDLALVTSGDYQRYYVVDGVRYHHLIDPATLWPAAYFDGVSVLAPDSGVADCLTTGLFCMPLEEGQKLVESLDGVEALWCTMMLLPVISAGTGRPI